MRIRDICLKFIEIYDTLVVWFEAKKIYNSICVSYCMIEQNPPDLWNMKPRLLRNVPWKWKQMFDFCADFFLMLASDGCMITHWIYVKY